MIATCVLLYCPRQTSVSPPDATAMLPRFSSPAESTAEVGSRSVALHTFPRAVTNFAFCGSMVGYAFAGMIKRWFQQGITGDPGAPDRLCPRISSDPLVAVPKRSARAPCYPTKGRLVASAVRAEGYCLQIPGLRPLRGSNHEAQRQLCSSWP